MGGVLSMINKSDREIKASIGIPLSLEERNIAHTFKGMNLRSLDEPASSLNALYASALPPEDALEEARKRIQEEMDSSGMEEIDFLSLLTPLGTDAFRNESPLEASASEEEKEGMKE